MTPLAFYSSRSGNTARLIDRLGLGGTPLPPVGDPPRMDAPFVLVTPTYADGEGRGAVPKPVIRFLNHAPTRALLRGVIACGNRNFGETFALAGDVIARKCGVPVLARVELAGTETDIIRIRAGLSHLFADLEAPCSIPA
ncbi:ribonucleotide reductase stimulatory protein [Roseivivax halodurans JCM 10272]|uniref:Protein NrdI n=1 Tax=Roseivivax halodurans JCM 10272 TaxID=1449350 RepID=X7EJ55_9RHOB|nr:class Ib ribonucleoside-diphosphate reductase assembly flavoprotein NrdI [Roseivivax halodurans]ETX15927.1 ribonucleotide reductase stimulatory protein [Roseivivax halodurans JCM 10272]